MYAGQGAGLITGIESAHDIVARLDRQARGVLALPQR
jgi:hypothetical protein